jgi:hypothetical protein
VVNIIFLCPWVRFFNLHDDSFRGLYILRVEAEERKENVQLLSFIVPSLNMMTNTVIFEKNVLMIMIHFYMTHGKICCLLLDKFDSMLSKMSIY